MKKPYVIKCLDARYDEDHGVLVLLGLFEELGIQRLIHYSKSDFHYKGGEVPHKEMHKTAALWRGKKFKQYFDSDPARNVSVDDNIVEEQLLIRSAFDEEVAIQARLDNLAFGV